MPKRVPTISVVVVRAEKRVEPPVGKAFDFTAEEIKTINDIHPGALRNPVNELADDTATEDAPAAKKGKAAKPAAAKPAEKAPVEDSDDGEGEDEDI